MQKLSILMAVYNEARTIGRALDRVHAVVLAAGLPKEIIVVNDGSTDATHDAVLAWQEKHPAAVVKYHRHENNRGKGAALRTAIGVATGDVVIIQDADLEYDPGEYDVLLKPVLNGTADVVYGSRFVGGRPHRILFFWHSMGNKFLTFLSNMFTNLNLSDMETGYKLFRTQIIKGLDLKEDRFGFEPEVTAKVARIKNIRIYEVGISYYGRSYEEGKHINFKDGFHAIYCILKYGLLRK